MRSSHTPSRTKNFRKPKNPAKTLARLLRYMSNYKILLLLVLFFALASSVAGVAGIYFLKPLINGITPLIGKSPAEADLVPFIKMIIIVSVIYLFGTLATYLYSRVMATVSNKTLNSIRQDLFEKMQDLPVKYFDTHTHGELMSRYTNDVDTLRMALSFGITQLFTSAVTVTGTFIMMLVLSPILTLLVIAMLFLMFYIIKKIGSKSAANFKRQQQAVGMANGYIEEMIEGQKVVKVFTFEEHVKKEFEELNEELRQVSTKANTYANIIMPIMGNLSYVTYAFTAALGAVLIIRGYYTDLGFVASYLQYTRSFSQPIAQISQQFNSILAALAGAERIFEVIDEIPEVDDGNVTLVNINKNPDGTFTESERYTGFWAWKQPQSDGAAVYTQLAGDVRIEGVSFSYEEEKNVLSNLSLYAKPGQKVAFVGSTGAGKTTITNLINRFYDVSEGKITYDGIDIKKIKKDDLRRSLAMVLQDTHLFTGTVRENIRYGRLDATDEEVKEAAKRANAHKFIKLLPQGYDTKLFADGSNLSQGQRQLIAVARAAIANPPVLILDEATSSIDSRTEALIEKGMDELMKGRTVFVIAHRLSTVRNADVILVLENGEIIERGTHDDLLNQQGKYYQLYTGQFELS